MLQVKSARAKQRLVSMKIYQCTNCHAVFRSESDRDAHAGGDETHKQMREYELDEFLTRFIVAA